jgi:hypothetical protein
MACNWAIYSYVGRYDFMGCCCWNIGDVIMTTKDNGGPAFPLAFEDATITPDTYVQYGMTLRDYFAAKAMQGYIAAAWNASDADLASASYCVADAMLKERAK